MTSKLSAHYYNLGIVQVTSNNLSSATNFLKKSVCYDSENINSWNLLGLCFYKMAKFPMAEYCWTESLKNGDTNHAMYYLDSIGNSEMKEAVSCLSEAVKLAEYGKYKKSLSILEENKVIPLIQSPQLINYMGILKYLSRNKMEAKADWQKATQLDKSDIRATLYIEYMCKKEGRFLQKLRSTLPAIFEKKV